VTRHSDAELLAREADGLRAFYRLIASGGAGARLIELDGGVQACIVPAVPERSIVNGVVYAESHAAASALRELAELYDAAGVEAWTVWVHPGDDRLAGELGAAGHVLDAQPVAMGATLAELDLAERAPLALDPAPTWDAVAAINDAAYGLEPSSGFGRALRNLAAPDAQLYVALADGEPAASTVAIRHGDDCSITFVATLPHVRGRGLASGLMRVALREARDDGCATTTLEATALGAPVYRAMGYRTLGTLQMWERRRPSAREAAPTS
jgi:GNAT superfamily N-acetyltransferase